MGKKKNAETLPPEAEENANMSDGQEIPVDESDLVTDAEEAPEDAAPDHRAEAERNKDLYLRALADLENYRKRAQREKEDAIRFANSNLLREMIPVIDNLERAVEHANGSEEQNQVLLEGVKMTLVQFRKVLEGFGVKVVESHGEPFNPEFHQAMGEMVTDDCAPGSVAQELQKAYTLNGRLLRPALVMVARAPEADASADEAPAAAGTEENSEEPGPENGADDN